MSGDAPAETAPRAAPFGALAALAQALRPRQWVKNAVLGAGIVFTLDQAHPASDWLRVLGAIAVFCALSSAIYLINDLCDLEQDRQHPRKRLRPIPSGRVSPAAALATAGLLGAGGLGAAVALGGSFLLAAGAYVVLTLGYTFWFKHQVFVDVLSLALCYVLRAVAGAAVIMVEISPWLLVCTLFGSLLIGLAKRRNELITLDDAGSHRRILDDYSIPLLDSLVLVVASCTLMAYVLYTIPTFSRTAQERPLMMATIPFVVYGLFRYFWLVHHQNKGGDPSAEIFEDRALVVCGILWALTAVAVMLFTG